MVYSGTTACSQARELSSAKNNASHRTSRWLVMSSLHLKVSFIFPVLYNYGFILCVPLRIERLSVKFLKLHPPALWGRCVIRLLCWMLCPLVQTLMPLFPPDQGPQQTPHLAIAFIPMLFFPPPKGVRGVCL